MTEVIERPINGAGFAALEPVTVDQIMDVLAQRVPTDPNGFDAEYWRKKLDENDYFVTQTPQMERQILFTLASRPCAGNRQAHEYLRFMVQETIGEQT